MYGLFLLVSTVARRVIVEYWMDELSTTKVEFSSLQTFTVNNFTALILLIMFLSTFPFSFRYYRFPLCRCFVYIFFSMAIHSGDQVDGPVFLEKTGVGAGVMMNKMFNFEICD